MVIGINQDGGILSGIGGPSSSGTTSIIVRPTGADALSNPGMLMFLSLKEHVLQKLGHLVMCLVAKGGQDGRSSNRTSECIPSGTEIKCMDIH